MIIGLCGGICAGKGSIADFLISTYQFKEISLVDEVATTKVKKSGSDDSNSIAEHVRSATHEFNSAGDLLEFVTKHWRENWVVANIVDQNLLDLLIRRPFFLLVSVDAPLLVRWKRFTERCETLDHAAPSLEKFVEWNDAHICAPVSGIAAVMEQAEVRLVNGAATLDGLRESLLSLNLVDEERLRPSWDQYFMRLASLAAHRSNCMKRRVGCVVVRERRVISTGYNGTPRNLRNCNEGGCSRCNGGQGSGVGLATCLCLHAEENALLEAGRERIREGSILYCDTCPCLTCSIKITQVGITEVVYSQGYSMDQESAAIFAEGGVKFRQFSPVWFSWNRKLLQSAIFSSSARLL